uniref:Uncharacterized protein n=1 Tax=Panagrolaimus sp. JU765 TaxID=591449 RepID=A0AC34R2C0_9BILA
MVTVPVNNDKNVIVSTLPYVLGSHKVVIMTPLKMMAKKMEYIFSGKYFASKQMAEEGTFLNEFLPIIRSLKSSELISDIARYELVVIPIQDITESGITLCGESHEIPPKYFKKFDFIIVYEAQRYGRGYWDHILELFNDKKIMFLYDEDDSKKSKKLDLTSISEIVKITL